MQALLKGEAAWIENGAKALADAMSSTPEGQRVLINAGDLIPGTRAMQSLVTRIGSKSGR